MKPITRMFASASTRQREADLLQRRLKREAERTLDAYEAELVQLQGQCETCMKEAKRLLRIGDEAGARHQLSSRLSLEDEIGGRQNRLQVLRREVRKFEGDVNDRKATRVLRGMGQLRGTDPAELDGVFIGMEEKAEDRRENERLWTDAHGRQMRENGVGKTSLPSIEQMLAGLQQEVALETEAENGRAAGEAAALAADIEAGRRQINAMLETLK